MVSSVLLLVLLVLPCRTVTRHHHIERLGKPIICSPPGGSSLEISALGGSALGTGMLGTSALSTRSIGGGGRPLSTPIMCSTGSSVIFARKKFTRLCKSKGIGCRGVRLKTRVVAVGVSDDAICTHKIVSSIKIRGKGPIFGSKRAPCRAGTVQCGFGDGGKFVGGIIARRKRNCIMNGGTGGNTGSRLFVRGKQCAAYSRRSRPRFCVRLAGTGIHPGGGIMAKPTCLMIRSMPLPLTMPFFFFPFSDDCSSNFIVPDCVSSSDHNFNLANNNCCFTIDSLVSLGLATSVFAGNS